MGLFDKWDHLANGIQLNSIEQVPQFFFSYCFHLFNAINYGLAQSDPFNRRLLTLLMVMAPKPLDFHQ
jgi:hypothetical protein